MHVALVALVEPPKVALVEPPRAEVPLLEPVLVALVALVALVEPPLVAPVLMALVALVDPLRRRWRRGCRRRRRRSRCRRWCWWCAVPKVALVVPVPKVALAARVAPGGAGAEGGAGGAGAEGGAGGAGAEGGAGGAGAEGGAGGAEPPLRQATTEARSSSTNNSSVRTISCQTAQQDLCDDRGRRCGKSALFYTCTRTHYAKSTAPLGSSTNVGAVPVAVGRLVDALHGSYAVWSVHVCYGTSSSTRRSRLLLTSSKSCICDPRYSRG